jgi:hypothetical protein
MKSWTVVSATVVLLFCILIGANAKPVLDPLSTAAVLVAIASLFAGVASLIAALVALLVARRYAPRIAWFGWSLLCVATVAKLVDAWAFWGYSSPGWCLMLTLGGAAVLGVLIVLRRIARRLTAASA